MNSVDTSLKVKIVLCCLLAPFIDANFDNLIGLMFNYCIGLKPEKVTYFGVLGCPTETWMSVAGFFFIIPFSFGTNMLGYKLSQQDNVIYKLLGALLLYSFIFSFGKTMLFLVVGGSHPFSFLEYKIMSQERAVPLFGNMYTFLLVSRIIDTALRLFYLYLCYLVVFRYWDKQMRIYFFTYGAAACALGLYLWYFVLGPFFYN